VPDPIIRVENLGKKYLIRHEAGGQRYKSLRDTLANGATNFSRRLGYGAESSHFDSREEFWALRDVSFEVQRGDVVGIIGRNGAGKSTLLKILSEITEPTTGRVELNGRVASLLEVGTGFHPELTGRENIFLNGTILGMTRKEISRKFDEIVAFAEIEKFLDTPVKRYSSGMYVRLAFAVAAHLEPEILIVDEVLAVGDAQFQKKCLGKMRDASKGGRTVLFVSHNLGAVQALCVRGILLDQGAMIQDSTAANCVCTYLSQDAHFDTFKRSANPDADAQIVAARLETTNDSFASRLIVHLEVWSRHSMRVSLDLRLSEAGGLPVGYGSLGTLVYDEMISLEGGTNHLSFSLSLDHLANGSYIVSLDLTVPFQAYLDRVDRCLTFDLERPMPAGRSAISMQTWGFGSLEIPLRLERETATNSVRCCAR